MSATEWTPVVVGRFRNRVVTDADVDTLAHRLWDADSHPASVEEREWPEVDGLMRMAYMGRAAHVIMLNPAVLDGDPPPRIAVVVSGPRP